MVHDEQTGKELSVRGTQFTYDDRESRDDLSRRSGPMVAKVEMTRSLFSRTNKVGRARKASRTAARARTRKAKERKA